MVLKLILNYMILKRKHQCATIQLDFQLPERFELTYELMLII